MPYTPPSQRSPASSKPNSPILSRSQSYVNDSVLSSPVAARPSLPRSISSTSYLNKHRRSPSISQGNGSQGSGSTSSQGERRASANGSLRQSPPPVNNLLIPTGAITTPPDSASDDEDRGRQLGNLAELQEALQSIKQRRGHSPERNVDGAATTPERNTVKATNTQAPSTPPPPSHPALTPEARKITHSRSSSEIQLSSLASNIGHSPEQTSSDESDEEDELRIKPPLVRKKSGELVKPALRPSSRRRPSSMPGTPTFSKAVHFNDDIEQVRHFLQVDRPIAVSAGSSPVETYDSDMEYPFDGESGYSRRVEWDLKLANFPRDSLERKAMPIRLERLFLASDNKTLIGTVVVANLAFQKLVVARFTLDYWKTTSEVVAEYNNDVRKKQANDGCDRFNFNIKLADQANLERKTMLLCVRYNVEGREYWDNNNNMNFQIDFVKKKAVSKNGRHNRSISSGTIPRSRHTPSTGRPKSFPSAFDDDFSSGFDSKYQFGSPKSSLLRESTSHSIHLKSKSNRTNSLDQGLRSSNQQQPISLAFSSRYDFGASLSAALNTAQSALGDRSGLSMKRATKNNGEVAPKAASAPETPFGPRPDTLSSEKPDLKSAEYNELIQKFCFFGSTPGKSTAPISAKPPVRPDASDSDLSSSSKNSSGSSTPTPPQDMSPAMDGANDMKPTVTKNPSNFLSRSTSPGPLTGSDFPERTRSPMNFGYPYNHSIHGGILGESHAPQPIVG